MVSYNFVVLSGKIITSPRQQYRPDGSRVIEFPLELNDINGMNKRKGKINIVATGELAEKKSKILECGMHLLVKGRLKQRSWHTPQGQKRTSFEIIATDLKPIEKKLLETKKVKGEK